MKKIVLFLCFFWTSNLMAQTTTVIIPKNEAGLAEYSEIIKVDSVSKSQLYAGVLEWVTKTYKSGKTVIQTTDKETGSIIGKAATQNMTYNTGLSKMDAGYFMYTLNLFCKDGKVKCVIDDIYYKTGDLNLNSGANLGETYPSNWTGLLMNNKQTRRHWANFQKDTDAELRATINDLKNHLSQLKKKNDW